jgi:rubredoxin
MENTKMNAPTKSDTLHVWQCLLCSFSYDEAAGMPEEGIAPGTRWADVPETWTCPDCSANKSDFDMVVVA